MTITSVDDEQLIEAVDTPKPPPRTDWTVARGVYAQMSQKYGKGSPEANAAEIEFWCTRLSHLIVTTLSAHEMSEEQLKRLALCVYIAGRRD